MTNQELYTAYIQAKAKCEILHAQHGQLAIDIQTAEMELIQLKAQVDQASQDALLAILD